MENTNPYDEFKHLQHISSASIFISLGLLTVYLLELVTPNTYVAVAMLAIIAGLLIFGLVKALLSRLLAYKLAKVFFQSYNYQHEQVQAIHQKSKNTFIRFEAYLLVTMVVLHSFLYDYLTGIHPLHVLLCMMLAGGLVYGIAVRYRLEGELILNTGPVHFYSKEFVSRFKDKLRLATEISNVTKSQSKDWSEVSFYFTSPNCPDEANSGYLRVKEDELEKAFRMMKAAENRKSCVLLDVIEIYADEEAGIIVHAYAATEIQMPINDYLKVWLHKEN